jgi:hypothetical protein
MCSLWVLPILGESLLRPGLENRCMTVEYRLSKNEILLHSVRRSPRVRATLLGYSILIGVIAPWPSSRPMTPRGVLMCAWDACIQSSLGIYTWEDQQTYANCFARGNLHSNR